MKYSNGELIKIGDIFTDGASGRECDRLKCKAKVLYVDKFTLVWFPLNDITAATSFQEEMYTSKDWCLTSKPKKVDISELTEEELNIYNNTKYYLEYN